MTERERLMWLVIGLVMVVCVLALATMPADPTLTPQRPVTTTFHP